MKISPWLTLGLIAMSACSSTPAKDPAPEWTRQSTRLIEGGYIIYLGHAEASTMENAQFKAAGMALEDLANECSMIPKGTRLEDRYSDKISTGFTAFAKIAIEFPECEHAMKTNDPAEIKKIGNIAFTEQLKRYQDLNETGVLPEAGEGSVVQPLEEVATAPVQGTWSERTHFYVVRQYVSYQKEIVVLSPPNTYAASSPESHKFIASVEPANQQIQGMVQKDASLQAKPETWSRIADRPKLLRPANLQPRAETLRRSSLVAPPKGVKSQNREARRPGGGKGGHRRKRRSDEG